MKIGLTNTLIKTLSILCILPLSACSVLSPVQPVTTHHYLLTQTPTPTLHASRRGVLVVGMPEANPAINTTQMAYTQTPYQLAYFSQNDWAETPPQMLQPLLIQALQATHAFKAVMLPPYTGQYQYQLNTQLLEFKQDYSRSVPVFVMTVDVQLFHLASNQVSATARFSQAIPLPQKTPYGGVFAANVATASILKQIETFCIRHTR